MRTGRSRPFVAFLFLIALACAGALIVPWAFHIGGRPTPLLTWWGSGQLHTKGGQEYPIFISLRPSSHSSRLRLDGLRPTSGLGGSACLCTAPGAFQYLNLSGTLYGAWSRIEDGLIQFRLLEITVIDVGQKRAGFFDMTGRWDGPELVMAARGTYSSPFRSGLHIVQPSVRFHWNPYWTCKSACASVANVTTGSDLK